MAILAMIHGLPTRRDATSAPMVRSKLSESTAVLMMLAIALPIPVFGEESRSQPNEEAVAAAVDRAVSWLLTRQDEEIGLFSMEVRDGRWQSRPQGGRAVRVKVPRTGTAMTSLAIMGLCSVGHLPADPTPEGRALARALEFVLRDELIDDNGYFGKADGSRMYGHGITTLMLAEALGMGVSEEQDERIRERLQAAIDLILRSQRVKKQEKFQGGWRYTPRSPGDTSASGWQSGKQQARCLKWTRTDSQPSIVIDPCAR